jgi:pSer/pThr/pTyr-binding forkhead associated (FHA) protein
MQITLRVLVGSEFEREVPVTSRRFMIGRAEDCDLQPTCPMVSRYHCELIVDGQQVTLRDAKSKNGTYVNGERVAGQRELRSGDLIGFGLRRVAVHIAARTSIERRMMELTAAG